MNRATKVSHDSLPIGEVAVAVPYLREWLLERAG